MHIETHVPSDLLKPYIRHYLVIESADELVNRVLPGTAPVMAFRFKGRVNYLTGDKVDRTPAAAISGLRKSFRLINYTPGAGTVLVQFKEVGITAFFTQPLHELFEESISLDHFISRQTLADVEEQLAEATNNQQRIKLIETFLSAQLPGNQPDQLIAAAINKIHMGNGAVKIKELANTLYISHDAFEKRFRRAVGSSPKQFSSIVRMKAFINRSKQGQPLTRMALDAGYFDQAHFNKEFKIFTGQTPSLFFRSDSFW